MNKFFTTIICLSVFSLNAFACGGGDLSDAEMAKLPYVQKAQEKMATVFNTPVVIESIIRSGNDILNLDKEATISAMCAANFMNVYLTSKEASELLCQITFQINEQGEADFSGLNPGLVCRKTKAESPTLIELD